MLDKINQHPKLLWLAYCGVVFVPVVINLADIIKAVRWW